MKQNRHYKIKISFYQFDVNKTFLNLTCETHIDKSIFMSIYILYKKHDALPYLNTITQQVYFIG